MFRSFTLKDIVEVEPVYFPRGDNLGLSSQQSIAGKESTLNTDCSSEEQNNRSCSERKEASVSIERASTLPLPVSAPRLSLWSEIILHRLTERYVGKVVPALGFCVAVEHVLEYTPCEVKGPTGSAWLTAVFDICIFAPLPDSRLRATIVRQDETGVFLSIDFFSAFIIFVPGAELVEGSHFDPTACSWALPVEDSPSAHSPSSAAGDSTAQNYYTVNEDVIAKVLACSIITDARLMNEKNEPLMSITASFRGECLGPVAWYEDEDST